MRRLRSVLVLVLAFGLGYGGSTVMAHTANGGAGDNNLVGHDHVDYLDGNGGDDRVEGRGDNDDVRGGEGADRVSGEGGNDLAIGGAGFDHYVMGGCGNDDMRGGDGGDSVGDGPCGRDWLYGEGGADTLSGHGDCGDSPDNFRGGAAWDHCLMDGADGNLEESKNDCEYQSFFYC